MMQLSIFPNFLDSKMIGIDRGKKSSTMINKVDTMTPRQNDLLVKNQSGGGDYDAVTSIMLYHC